MTILRSLLFRAFFIFVVLFPCTFSFGYHLIPEPGDWLNPLFERLAIFTGDHLFGINRNYTSALISDSTGLYLHAFNCTIISLAASLVWTLFDQEVNPRSKILLLTFIRYYLALQLLQYGASKVFKVQFYLPEPNILYTKLGDVPKDLLYWSAMGVSRPYSIFLGIGEIIAGSLLLFRRTTLFGAVLTFFILVNIAAINLAYDISVKLLTGFLLLLTSYLLWADRSRLFGFISGRPSTGSSFVRTAHPRNTKLAVLKLMVVALLLGEAFLPYLWRGHYNDDTRARPLLHGAWEVEHFAFNNDTLAQTPNDTVRWKRIFIHRRNYLIIEKATERMEDYKLDYDLTNKILLVYPYQSTKPFRFSWHTLNDSTIMLQSVQAPADLKVTLKRLHWEHMPALRHEFGWTADE